MGHRGSPPATERNDEIVRLRESGEWTLQELADRYEVSRERIRQICNRAGLPKQFVRRAARYDRVTWVCAHCGKEELRTRCNAERKFCSKTCYNRSRGSEPFRVGEHLFIGCQFTRKTIRYARYLVQEQLGRALDTDEWVTLKDKSRDPSPDEMDNLFWGSPSEVMRFRQHYRRRY